MESYRLSSYGTLQQPKVQLETFGRLLEGELDTLIGYGIDHVEITDQDVLSKSGKAFHPILRYTGLQQDLVTGTAFVVSAVELDQADRYEVSAYIRIAVTLASGLQAQVYVARDTPSANQD